MVEYMEHFSLRRLMCRAFASESDRTCFCVCVFPGVRLHRRILESSLDCSGVGDYSLKSHTLILKTQSSAQLVHDTFCTYLAFSRDVYPAFSTNWYCISGV